MKLKSLLAAVAIAAALFTHQAQANNQLVDADEANFMDEFDPTAEGADQVLDFYKNYYESETGESLGTSNDFQNLLQNAGPSCHRMSCKVYAHVKRSEQRLYLYVDGRLEAIWPTSTGGVFDGKSFATPDMEGHPYHEIFNKYSSKKYPGGDYKGLGNMPYAVFFKNKRGQGRERSGYAIHGTGTGNWKKLGRPASHGCVRIHPDNAYLLNTFVRSVGVNNTWMRVSN